MNDMICDPSHIDGRRNDCPVDYETTRVDGDGLYECRVVIACDGPTGFIAKAMRLPGIVAYGSTAEAAAREVREAFRGALQAYIDNRQDIPWIDEADPASSDAEQRWFIVELSQPRELTEEDRLDIAAADAAKTEDEWMSEEALHQALGGR